MYAVALLLGIVSGEPPGDSTELVEINHCYSRETGQRRFVQVIYWDGRGGENLHVREWHMADKCQRIYQHPDRADPSYTIIRQHQCDQRIIRARRVKVTHTFHDPEEDDRKLWPIEARRPLGK